MSIPYFETVYAQPLGVWQRSNVSARAADGLGDNVIKLRSCPNGPEL